MQRTTRAEPLAAELYAYQDVGRRWLAADDHRAKFLGDEMGLGKTVQAIRAADELEAETMLVISPAVGIYNWAAEVFRFSLFERDVQVIATGRDIVRPGASVVVLSHAMITKPAIRLQLIDRRWAVCVIDEADAFKTYDAQRTEALYGIGCCGQPGSIVFACDRVWPMSGTPAPNDASELWTHLRALRPETITDPKSGQPRSYHSFIYHFCAVKATRFGPKVMGNRRVKELRANALRPFIMRRMKADVLPDLPPIAFDVVTLASDAIPAELAELEALIGPDLLVALEALDRDNADPREVLKMLEADEEHLARLRRVTGMLKVTPTIELLRAHFAQKPSAKVVLFAHHKDVIARLMAEAKVVNWGAVKLDGSTSNPAKFLAVEKFQTDPKCVLFVGQLQAASTAVTLTASSDVMFVEASWTPRDNAQAAARAHRITQTNPVRVQFLSLAGSIDEAVQAVLVRKVRMLRELFAA